MRRLDYKFALSQGLSVIAAANIEDDLADLRIQVATLSKMVYGLSEVTEELAKENENLKQIINHMVSREFEQGNLARSVTKSLANECHCPNMVENKTSSQYCHIIVFAS